MMKKCIRCHLLKNVSEFYKDKSRKDGLCFICKECFKITGKKYRENNKEKIKLRKMKYYANFSHRIWASDTLKNHYKWKNKIEITVDELTEIAKQVVNCPICGYKINWNYGNKGGKPQFNSPSLDRIDNGNIINKNTIQIICYRCNSAKLRGTNQELLNYCIKVSYNNFLKPIDLSSEVIKIVGR